MECGSGMYFRSFSHYHLVLCKKRGFASILEESFISMLFFSDFLCYVFEYIIYGISGISPVCAVSGLLGGYNRLFYINSANGNGIFLLYNGDGL